MKRKALGIGVAGIVFLLLSVATIVPVTATPTAVKISTTTSETDFDAIDEIFLKYKDDLAEIDAYIQDYIAKHGAIDENFILPSDLQVKFDNIVNELKEYYPLGDGDIILPVSGTDDNSWVETWGEPVYMKDFHYTTSARSDVHLRYKNSNGNWIEFDHNYWKPIGSFTDTINDDVYGIKLDGWCPPGKDCTYTWEWYTDANGNKCYTVPTGGGGNDGKNGFDVITYSHWWPPDFGFIYRIWTDHEHTQRIADYMPWGIAMIASILGAVVGGGIIYVIIFCIASLIVGDFTEAYVRAKDHGMGVRWDCYDSWIWTPPRVIDSIALYSQ